MSSYDGSRSARQSKRYSMSALYMSISANEGDLQIEDELAKAQKALRDLKSKISSQSKKNFVLEKDVRYLDSRIALLIQNRMALEEQNEVASHLEDALEMQQGVFPNDDKTQKYGNLLFLLQSEPRHIAHLCRLVSMSEIDSLLQTVMFTIYGNQYESREEHLLLTMFQSVLTYQFDNTPDYSSLLRANTPVSRMMTTYTRRGPGQSFLKSVLADRINGLIELKDLDLEINPLKVYERMIEQIEEDTGQLPPHLPKGITGEQAAENPQVQAIIEPRLTMLTEIANGFLTTIIEGLEEAPYGIRWICKQIRSLTKRKYPDANDQVICTLIGGFFFLRFINPAIVTPKSYMLIDGTPAERPRRTLTYIAKMLQNLANKPSYAKEPYMAKLQPFIHQNKDRINKFMLDLCEVQDFYESLEMDNYVALSKKDLELEITLNEVYAMHSLLDKHHDELCKDDNSHLAIIMSELGSSPPQLPRKENRVINLPLFSRWESAIGDLTAALDITQEEVYFMEAKSIFVQVMRSIPATSGELRVIDKADQFSLLRDEVEQELQHLGSLKEGVITETQKLQEVYKTIRDHNVYLNGQLETYKSYLHNVRSQSEGTKRKQQKQQVLGPYKFTHQQLEKEGVIQKSNVPDNRRANIYFNFTSPLPGTFVISLHYKGRNRGLLELDLKLDDLLEMQKDNQDDLDLEYVQFNVPKVLALLNKRFARKKGCPITVLGMAGRIRQPVDEAALEKYISEHVPTIKTPIDLKQFGFGQSNPTYQITASDGQRFVMRKKPPGKLLSKTAHKVEREYRIMHALENTDVAVPKTYCLCEDDSVIGTPFYIMEFLDGRIFEDFTMPGVQPAEREAMWRDAVITLARFHAVDYKKVGLEKFGKPSGFYSRQINTWVTICGSQEKAVDIETKEPVGKLPHFEETVRFFKNERLQPKDRATLVHGDYKIDNLVFHKTEPRVIGILDWEMSTVGHPLSDICNFLINFYSAKSPGATPYDASGFLPGKTPGLPQPEKILEWYTEESGYDPRPEVPWGMSFSIWKLAGVCQGIAARYALRQASSEKAKQHAVTRGSLAKFAWALAKEAGADETGTKLTSGPENRDALYSCMTDPHSHLPVYTNIHRIRRDIISVVEDYLSLAQLQDLRINVTVVRPLVDKFYGLNDISIIYCLLVNRAQFLEEQSHLNNRHNVNFTRATLCELIATRILRRFGEVHDDGHDGLLLLAHILVAGFEPFQNAPEEIREEAERTTSWVDYKTLPALEVAIVTESKHFLSSATCQKVVNAIYEGRIVYTPSTFWDIIPDHYKLKPISIYDPRESPLLNQYRLIVPRTRNVLESIQFATLLTLYVAVMVLRRKTRYGPTEAAFSIFAFGWGLDQFATILAHGWSVYTQNLWSFLDVAFVLIYWVYLVLRFLGWKLGDANLDEQAFDVLALAAPVLVPRLAFNLLSDNLVFLSLRSMMADFFFLTALSAWCFLGFLLSLLWLGEGAHPILTISKWMIYIWFGLDGTGIHRSTEFHWLLGPSVMVAFAFLGNTLFLTILVSMLSNTFSNISSNAIAEISFRRAVLTLEGVKADAVFAYQPPFNILAVFLFIPLKFVVSPRWFHKIHVTAVKILNLPLLLIIAVAERRLLWPSREIEDPTEIKAPPPTKSQFWKKWRLTVHRDLRAVFQVPPPDTVHDDIAVDDDLTHHLIRRQFTRNATNDIEPRNLHNTPRPDPGARRPSRRDSMFPGIPPQKLRGSFSENDMFEGTTDRLANMEKAIRRMETMLSRLVPSVEDAISDDELEQSGTLRGDNTAESSFRGLADPES
ncbi:hypothetical protein ACJA88_003946 [Fusarium oxysporum]